MGIGSWRGPLMATGLLETTTTGKYKIRLPVGKLFTREQPLYLDEKGIEGKMQRLISLLRAFSSQIRCHLWSMSRAS